MSDDVRFESAGIASFLLGLIPLAFLALLVTRARRDPANTKTALLATVLAGVLTLELTWNERWYLIGPQFWLVETALVGGLITASWLACGRRRGGPALVLAALYAIGLIQHFVLEFRGTSVLPSDVYALGTALSVSGGYTYGISGTMVLGLASLALGLVSIPAPRRTQEPRGMHAGIIRDLGMATLVGALVVALVVVPPYNAVFGANIDYWWSKDWYQRQGFLPSFIFAWQDLEVPMPEGYSPQAAAQAQQELVARREADDDAMDAYHAAAAQFATAAPNVVVIQNETFCDLSNFRNLDAGYEGPSFWNTGMPDALARGSLAVSVFGGGTCNTEFEFLTGNSLAFTGTAKYPFTMYDLSTTDSLPRQLAAQGYHTVGLHPNLASNWNRDRAYEQLGFDEFLSLDDFAGAEEYHTHVSDAATYHRVLDLIQANDAPVFAFDVTMQNHSGYDTGSIPAHDLPHYHVEGMSAEDNGQLNEYLACIAESDRALEELVAQLKECDEPTVVVMYGDHHPWFSEALNDALFPHEDELTHAERIHQTTYVIWANYTVSGMGDARDATSREDDASADLLAAITLNAIGAPLTMFQQAQLGARTDVRALNAKGYLGSDGLWHALDEPGPSAATLHQLELQEYLNFGSAV